MVQTQSLPRRSWAGLAGLIAVSVALIGALALGYTLVLLIPFVALAGLLALRLVTPALPAATVPLRVGAEPRVQRQVLAADGSARQALVVPAAAAEGYQAVLTIDGYALVNAEGRVVYALNRAARAETDEPTVVSVLDAEAEPTVVSVLDAEAELV